MKEERHVIWSNYGLDYEDWRDDLEAEYPDLSENERISLMYEINGDYLDDERANLNVQLSQPILVVGDLGLWNGRRMGYKEIPSGNIRDCLYSDTDYSTWYVDRLGDLRCDAAEKPATAPADSSTKPILKPAEGIPAPFIISANLRSDWSKLTGA